MHKGRAFSQRSGRMAAGMLTFVLLIGSLFGGAVLSRVSSASAASSGTSYSYHQLKFGGGGWVTGMAIHPTTQGLMYIRTDVGGVYRLDANDTWTQLIVNTAVPDPTASDYNVEAIAVSQSNDQVLYVAAGDDYDTTTSTGRILKSTNRGQSFTDSGQRWFMGGNKDWRQGSERISVDPHNDNVVYYASRYQGLWVSTDGAQHWSQVSTSSIPTGISENNVPVGVTFAIFDPNSGTTNGKTNRIYVGVAGSGIYETNDAGATWSNILSLSEVPYTGTVASDGTFYMGGSSTLQRYTPSSNSWKNVSPSSNASFHVAVDPTNAQRVIAVPGAAQSQQMWRSLDGGNSWTALNIAVSSPDIPWVAASDEVNYMSASQIYFDPFVKDKLWFPQGTGVWYSSDNTGSTITWNFYSKGIEETVATDIVAPPNGVPVTSIYDRQGSYHSDVNAYANHTLIDNVFWGDTSLDYSGNNPQFLVTAQAKNNVASPYGRGATSSDGGQTWNVFAGAPAGGLGGNIAVAASDTNDIVWLPSTSNFGHGLDPYYSLDKGQTFQGSGGISSSATHWFFWWASKQALTADKVQDHTFYVVTFDNNGTFYTSTDGGKTFTQAANAPACSESNNCHVYGQLHAAPGYAGNVWSSGSTDGLWYTTNGGASPWTRVAGVQDARAFNFGKALPGYSYPAIYLYGKANNDTTPGLYRSPDEGATWTRISDAPLGIYDTEYVVSGDMNIAGRVYIGFTGNGFTYGDDANLYQEPTPTPTPPQTPTPTPSATPTPVIANGDYTLTNRNSGLLLDDTSWGGAGTQQDQWAANSSTNQKWTVTSVGSGYYKITSDVNSLALTVSGASTFSGAAAVLQSYTGADSQLWQFVATSGGYYQVLNKNSGQGLDVSGASTSNGALIIQSTSSSSANSQQWSPSGGGTTSTPTPTPTSTPTGATIGNGTYTLTNHNSGLLLDDTSWGGAGTQQDQWAANSATNQKWTITSVGSGYYEIASNVNSLALTGSGTAAVLQSYTGTDKQLWQFVVISGSYYQILNKSSGQALDVSGASTGNGALIIQSTSSSSANSQQWLLTSA